MTTTYHVALKPADFARCKRFLIRHGAKPSGLIHPTLMAMRGKRLIGVFGTEPHPQAVFIAGPLFVNLPNPAFVMKNLLFMYEGLMQSAGVKQCSFGVQKENTRWRGAIEKMGYIQYHDTPEVAIYKRVWA